MRLRIVSDELWQRAKERQAERTHWIGEHVKRGLTQAAAIRAGAEVSSCYRDCSECSHCGSALAIAGANRYQCSGHTNGADALCSNNVILWRHVAEREVMAGIKRDLRSPEVIAEICRRFRAAVRNRPWQSVADRSARIAQLRAEIDNLADAIAGGALRASPTIAARLSAAEAELEQLELAQAAPAARGCSPTYRHGPRGAVEHLEETLAAGELPRAREEIRRRVGMVTMEADEHEVWRRSIWKFFDCSETQPSGSGAVPQRKKTAPCGAPAPFQPCGHSRAAKLKPIFPSASRTASSTVRVTVARSNFSKERRFSGGVELAVTTRRCVLGPHAVQCEK